MRERLLLRSLVVVSVFFTPSPLFAEKILLITGGDQSNDAAIESVLQAVTL
jgi:hypothetical protein